MGICKPSKPTPDNVSTEYAQFSKPFPIYETLNLNTFLVFSYLRSTDEDSCRSRRKHRQSCRSKNPFLVFFHRMRLKHPKVPPNKVAQVAGKVWSQLPMSRKKKYIDIAEAEKLRRRKLGSKIQHLEIQ